MCCVSQTQQTRTHPFSPGSTIGVTYIVHHTQIALNGSFVSCHQPCSHAQQVSHMRYSVHGPGDLWLLLQQSLTVFTQELKLLHRSVNSAWRKSAFNPSSPSSPPAICCRFCNKFCTCCSIQISVKKPPMLTYCLFCLNKFSHFMPDLAC